MVRLADYYDALKVLSSSIVESSLFQKTDFIGATFVQPECLIEVAFRLRNATLYRQCLTLLMGPWENPKFNDILNPKLKAHAETQYTKLVSGVIITQQALDRYFESSEQREHPPHTNLEKWWKSYCTGSLPIYGRGHLLPAFYRRVLNNLKRKECGYLTVILERMLSNNLLMGADKAEPGQGDFEDYFFCLEISDNDLPWVVNERRW